MELTDIELVERVRGGDDDAFRLLVERHTRSLYRTAYRITTNTADADDVVQETFLRVYRAIDSYDGRASFTTWAHRIAVIATNAATPDRVVLSAQMQREMAAALTAMSGNERTAFVLRHFEGMPLEEIGNILGIKTNATKNTIFRAVTKLRERLQPFTGTL
jgi:RNA polymerase sigma-70 factor, ECF subfamily